MKKLLTLALVATMLAASAPEAKAGTGCCDQGYEIKSAVCATCDQGYLNNKMAVAFTASVVLMGAMVYHKRNRAQA